MATSKEYKEFILEQLDLLDSVTCKAMMGEFLLYYNSVLLSKIYDNRLLVKIVDTNKKYHMNEQTSYETAKPMYLVDDVDNDDVAEKLNVTRQTVSKWKQILKMSSRTGQRFQVKTNSTDF